jgi:hypothetical protein
MRFGPNAGWDSDNLQMNSLCAYGLRGDAGRDQMPLLTGKFLPCANETAGWLCIVSSHPLFEVSHFLFSYPGLARG